MKFNWHHMRGQDAPGWVIFISDILSNMRSGALAGCVSGVLLFLLEAILLPLTDKNPSTLAVIAALLFSAATVNGALMASVYGIIVYLTKIIFRRLPRLDRDLPAALIIVFLLFAPCFWLIKDLASGKQAAKYLNTPARLFFAAACLACLAGALFFVAHKLMRWLMQKKLRLGLWSMIILLLSLAISGFLVDALVLRRLYDGLHFLLFLLYLLTSFLAAVLWWKIRPPTSRFAPPASPGLRHAIEVVFIVFVLCAGLGGRYTLTHHQPLRFTCNELTTATAKLLDIWPLNVWQEEPLFLEKPLATSAAISSSNFKVPQANIVLVTIDALRADHLSSYRYGRQTSPNIAAIAQRAAIFQRAYCPIPLTCYSVPSLHTGDYLKSTLALRASSPPTLAELLRPQGYATAAFYNRSIFFCDDERATSYGTRQFGFEKTQIAERDAQKLTDDVITYLQEHRQYSTNKLFLWVHYFDVHEPYEQHPNHYYGDQPVDIYDSEIAYVDEQLGRLVAALNRLKTPTIFVLTSDHGEEFKEHGGNYHGNSLYEEQVRVPLIIGVPGMKPVQYAAPVQTVDIAPTLLSLLGMSVPESMTGNSLVDILSGNQSQSRPAFAEVHFKKMARFNDWKLIHDYRRKYFELYNLANDPQEKNNLYGDHPSDAESLTEYLYHWYDAIQKHARGSGEERPAGIDRGRMGDPRALPQLANLLVDISIPDKWRREAAQLLGKIQDQEAAQQLWLAMGDDDQQVADEAAIALGEIKDSRAKLRLYEAVTRSDPDIRLRAGIALGRLDDRLGQSALLEALNSENWELANRAAHYLGFIGDSSTVNALLQAADKLQLRPRICLALGRIGRRYPNPRIFSFLLSNITVQAHAEVRQNAFIGLGFLGSRHALGQILPYIAEEPILSTAPETLTRLGGVGDNGGSLPGVDFSKARRGLKDGWGECHFNPSQSEDNYLGQTWCATSSTESSVQFTLLNRKPFDGEMFLRLKPLRPELAGATINIIVNGANMAQITLAADWQNYRLPSRARFWHFGINQVRFRLSLPKNLANLKRDFLAMDYLLLLPGPNKTKRGR